MNEKIIKSASEALSALNKEAYHDMMLSGAISILLDMGRELGPKLGFFLTVFDNSDPAEGSTRTTAYSGDVDAVATALGMEMIDARDVRFILNNARVNLDLFNEGLPEEEKLK